MWWLVCPQENSSRGLKSPPLPHRLSRDPLTLYLVGAGNAQFVEHEEEDLRTEDRHEEVGDGKMLNMAPKR